MKINTIDESARFDQLFVESVPTLQKRLYQQLGDPYDVEEAIQDVYVRLSSRSTRERCLAHPNPVGYLAVVAGNVARDAWRRRHRLHSAVKRAEALTVRGPCDGGISECEGRLFVSSVLLSMTPKEAEAIRLVDIHGHSLMEAGDLLGVHWGTVHRNRKRGLEKLRARMRDVRGGCAEA